MWVVVGSPFGFLGTAEGQIDNLEEQVASLQADLESGNSKVDDLQVEVQNKSMEVENLQSQVVIKNQQIASLQAQIGGKDNEIANLHSQILERKSRIWAKNSLISNLEQVTETLELEITELEEQLEQLELRVLGVYFSPIGGCEDPIVYWIDRSNVSIHVLIYGFTLDSIGSALVEAHNRGVEVQVVFEERQLIPVSEYERLTAAGVMVRTDANTQYMHNKVMIADGSIVITGSFDWIETAGSFNNENIIVLSSAHVASIYEEEFAQIWDGSQL